MLGRNTKITRAVMGSGDVTIENGSSIIVSNITIANKGASAIFVDFKDNSSSNTLFLTLTVEANNTVIFGEGFEFIADKGMIIDDDAALSDNVIVTVFHSSAGA